MQSADDIDGVCAALSLCLDAQWKLLRLLRDVIDRARKTLENQVAHLLPLLDRAQLRREEDQALDLRSVSDRGQQPSSAKREAEPCEYPPEIPFLSSPSWQVTPYFDHPESWHLRLRSGRAFMRFYCPDPTLG